MSVLVTGAAGLIGSQIVRTLLDRGESVVVLDRMLQTGRLDDLMSNGKIAAQEADVTDLNSLESIIRGNGIERIIHTAAILPPTSEEQPHASYEVNIGGTNNVFEAAHRNGVNRVVYPSSIATYGDQSDHGDAVLDEESRCSGPSRFMASPNWPMNSPPAPIHGTPDSTAEVCASAPSSVTAG